LFILKRIQEGYRTCCLCSFQRESKRGAGNVVFDHSKENPRVAQDISSFLIPKRILEGYGKCRLCSFQQKSKRGAGYVIFVHAKENPR
jgi:hypothetical protein